MPSYVLINLAITLIGHPHAVSYELEIAVVWLRRVEETRRIGSAW